MLSKADIERKRERLNSLNREALRLHGELEAHRLLRLSKVPEWMGALVFAVAEKRDVSPLDIMKHGRFQKVVRARNELFYLIKERRPDLSFPRMATWFGFDHTTIMHSVAKHAADEGLPALTGYSLEIVRARNAETSRRMRSAPAAVNPVNM